MLVILFFGVNLMGMEAYAKLQDIMTVVLIASLLIFGLYGMTKVDFTTYFTGSDFFRGGLKGFISAAALMAFTCSGGESCGFALAKDIKNPTKNVPLVTLLGVFAAVVTYVLMCTVAAGALPIEQVENQNLTVVANAIFSRPFYIVFVIGGAVFALLTSLNGFIASLRYPFEAMADDGWLPAFFNKKRADGYPYVLMIISVLLAIVPIIFDISFDTVVTLVSISYLPIQIYCNAACITLPKKYPGLWKKSIFHMPYPVYCVLVAFATLCSVYYAYSYLADYDYSFWAIAAVVTVALYLVAWLRVKTGGVNTKEVEERRARVIAELSAADNEE